MSGSIPYPQDSEPTKLMKADEHLLHHMHVCW